MDRYSDGDASAFPLLYDLLAPHLYGYALRQKRSRAAAEDVVQETLLRMHAARASYLRGSPVFPWAFAIARRLLIDQSRKASFRSETFTDASDDFESTNRDTPFENLHGKELAGVVRRVLEALPENQREAFELLRFDGLSIAEAAEMRGITENALKLRFHRACDVLKEEIRKHQGRK